MQQIAETQQHRQVRAAVAEAVDDFEQRHLGLRLVVLKPHGHVALLVYAEKRVAPSLDAVELRGFLRRPRALDFLLNGRRRGGGW